MRENVPFLSLPGLISLAYVTLFQKDSCSLVPPSSIKAWNAASTALRLKQEAQRRAMEAYGWSIEDFIREFGKNYLED